MCHLREGLSPIISFKENRLLLDEVNFRCINKDCSPYIQWNYFLRWRNLSTKDALNAQRAILL